MHAFMALFFYELVRDQIVFIWHAWAMVIGPQMIIVPVCRTMPSVLLWWRRQKRKRKGKKKTKTLLLTKRCQRQIFDHLCLHIYLFNNLLTSPETWAPLSTLISAASATSCRHIAKLRLGQTSETDTFQFFYYFTFFLPMIFNTKCSKTETLCTCASRGNSCQSRPRRVFFFVKMLFMQCQLEPLGSILERRSLKKKNPVK